jgi:hypothetical protein
MMPKFSTSKLPIWAMMRNHGHRLTRSIGHDGSPCVTCSTVAVQYEKVAPEAFKRGLLSVGVPEDMATNITIFRTCFYDGSAQVADHATTPGLEGLLGMLVQWCRFDAFVTEVGPLCQSAR